MGEWVKLRAEDGHELGGYLARPEGAPKAGVVVIQEIFGVNHHIQSVADRFAAEGTLRWHRRCLTGTNAALKRATTGRAWPERWG